MTVLRPLCFVLALLLPATPAAASVLYKCVLASGEVVIQSKACPKDSQQIWKRETAPDPQPTPEQAQQAELRRQQDARTARELSLLAGTTREEKPEPPPPPPPAMPEAPEPPKGQCRQAHEFADSARANNAWLELSDSQLYRLDEWVNKQCQAAREEE